MSGPCTNRTAGPWRPGQRGVQRERPVRRLQEQPPGAGTAACQGRESRTADTVAAMIVAAARTTSTVLIALTRRLAWDAGAGPGKTLQGTGERLRSAGIRRAWASVSRSCTHHAQVSCAWPALRAPGRGSEQSPKAPTAAQRPTAGKRPEPHPFASASLFNRTYRRDPAWRQGSGTSFPHPPSPGTNWKSATLALGSLDGPGSRSDVVGSHPCGVQSEIEEHPSATTSTSSWTCRAMSPPRSWAWWCRRPVVCVRARSSCCRPARSTRRSVRRWSTARPAGAARRYRPTSGLLPVQPHPTHHRSPPHTRRQHTHHRAAHPLRQHQPGRRTRHAQPGSRREGDRNLARRPVTLLSAAMISCGRVGHPGTARSTDTTSATAPCTP